MIRDGQPRGGKRVGQYAPQNFPPKPSPLPNESQWSEHTHKRVPMPPSTSPWARDDTGSNMVDRVQFHSRRGKGDFTRNDTHFAEPWATDLEDAGVPPPGFFGNGWKHPDKPPRHVPPSTLPYATDFLEPRHPDITLKPNQEKIHPSDFNKIHKHKLQSTGMAFLEQRAEESAGNFSQDARKDYLSELKAQMDGQKADRRMENLKHWGWNTGPAPDPRRKIFEKFDVDGSGTLTIEELKHVVKHPRVIAAFQLPRSMNHEEIEEFIEEIDINGDGVIDFDEFIAFIDAKAGDRAQMSEADKANLAKSGPGSHSLRRMKNEL